MAFLKQISESNSEIGNFPADRRLLSWTLQVRRAFDLGAFGRPIKLRQSQGTRMLHTAVSSTEPRTVRSIERCRPRERPEWEIYFCSECRLPRKKKTFLATLQLQVIFGTRHFDCFRCASAAEVAARLINFHES